MIHPTKFGAPPHGVTRRRSSVHDHEGTPE
jgi:hypothetical protein